MCRVTLILLLLAACAQSRTSEPPQVVWVAIGDRSAPARLDVDDSRLVRGGRGSPDDIYVRVLYDAPIAGPGNERVASVQAHFQVICPGGAYMYLGADAFDSANHLVGTPNSGRALPAWVSPKGMDVTRMAIPGYCRTLHPETHRWNPS